MMECMNEVSVGVKECLNEENDGVRECRNDENFQFLIFSWDMVKF